MLTKGEAKRVARYVEWLLPLMGLSEWRISVSRGQADEDAVAQVTITECQQLGQLKLGATFGAQSALDKKRTVVHELLHCHLDQMAQHVATSASTLGAPVYAVFFEGFRNCLELAVDNMAVAWADSIDDDAYRHLLDGVCHR